MERPFSQVVVWPGTLVGADQTAEFEAFILSELGTRAKYIEEIQTAPDMKNGFPVEGTGGRNDLFFAVHEEDISKFAVPRLAFGMRWVEDVLSNEADHGEGGLYPERVKEYCTW